MQNDSHFDLPLTIVGQLRALDREMQRYSTSIEENLGIKATDLWFLQLLERSPNMRLTEIADRLSIMQGSASNSLERLIKAGYVSKTPDPRDKRSMQLLLTEQGMDLLQKAPRNAKCPLRRAMEDWDAKLLQRLQTDLRRLLSDAEKITKTDSDSQQINTED